MIRPLNKTGFWLMLAALGWYVAFSFLSDHLDRENQDHAKTLQNKIQAFDISPDTVVLIRGPNKSRYPMHNIKLVIEPLASRLSIENGDSALTIMGKFSDRLLTISIDEVAVRHPEYDKVLVIHVPASVHAVQIAALNTLEVSGAVSAETGTLSLSILDSKPKISVKGLTIDHLILNSIFTLPTDNCGCDSGFVIKDAKINSLDVSMQHGSLDFSAPIIPQHIHLFLSDSVKITAVRDFLKTAEFAVLTP